MPTPGRFSIEIKMSQNPDFRKIAARIVPAFRSVLEKYGYRLTEELVSPLLDIFGLILEGPMCNLKSCVYGVGGVLHGLGLSR